MSNELEYLIVGWYELDLDLETVNENTNHVLYDRNEDFAVGLSEDLKPYVIENTEPYKEIIEGRAIIVRDPIDTEDFSLPSLSGYTRRTISKKDFPGVISSFRQLKWADDMRKSWLKGLEESIVSKDGSLIFNL